MPMPRVSSSVSMGVFVVLALPWMAMTQADPIPVAEIRRDQPVMFETDILPILQRNCLACHSRTERQGDLVLESRAEMLTGGDTGPALIPGKGEESLIVALAAHRRDPVMPPAGNEVAAVPLTSDELGLLCAWIDQGARVAGSGGGPSPMRWQPIAGAFTPALAVALAPDGQMVASAVANRLRLHHVATGGLISELVDPAVGADAAHRDVIEALAFDPTGAVLATGGFREVKLWHRPRDVKAWQATVGGALPLIAVSPDGMTVVTATGPTVKTSDAATGAPGRDFSGHTERVTALAFLPDGKTLVSASIDGMIRLSGVADGLVRGVVEAPGAVTAIGVVSGPAATPGEWLVVGGTDNQLRTFSVPQRAPQKSIVSVAADRRAMTTADRRWMAVVEPTDGNATRIEVLAVDDAGRTDPRASCTVPGLISAFTLLPGLARDAVPQIVVGMLDGGCALIEPAVAVGDARVLRRWRGGTAKVTSLAAAGDGKQVVCGLENGQVTLWRGISEGLPVAVADAGTTAVGVVAHHPSRRLAAVAGSADGRPVIRVVKLDGGVVAATLSGHEGGTTAIAFSADGNRIVSGGADGVVRLLDWSNAAAPEFKRFESAVPVTAVGVSPDLALVIAAGADNSVRTWTVADGMLGVELKGHGGRVMAVGFLAGNQPWSAGADRGVRFWNLPDGRQTSAWELPSPPTVLSLSADGATLVAAGEDKIIRTHVLSNGQVQKTFTGHSGLVVAASLSVDSTRLLSVERSAAAEGVFGWDVATGRLTEAVERIPAVPPAELAPWVGLLLDGQPDRSLMVLLNGRIEVSQRCFWRSLDAGQQPISSLAFIGNGQQVITASADGSIRGFQAESGQAAFTTGHGAPIRVLAVADDQAFATGAVDGSVRLWQAGGGAYGIQGINGLGGEVTALAWSPDKGRILTAVAAPRPTVFVHDTSTGQLLERFTGHAQPVTYLMSVGDGAGGAADSARWGISVAADGGWRWPLVAGRQTPGLNQNPVHGGVVTAVTAFPGDGGEVLTGCADGVARRVRLVDGQVVTQYAHGAAIAGIAVASDGQRLATVGENKLARLWQAGGQQVAELRGDVRLRTAVAGLTRQLATATDRATRAKQLLEAAEKDVPVRNDAFAKATAALAAATGDVQQKMTVLTQASDARIAAEKSSIATSVEARSMQQVKAKADLAVKEVGVELQVAQQRLAQRQSASTANPADAGLKQAVVEATAAVPLVQQKQQAAQGVAQTAAQALTNAVNVANEAARKAIETQKPASDAAMALRTAEGAKRLTMQQEMIFKREFEQAQAAVPTARESLQRAEGTLAETKNRLDAATATATAAELPIRRVTFSADSQSLVTIGDFPAVHQWDATTGAALSSYAGHQGGIVGGGFLAGARLVTLGADGGVIAWETNPAWRLAATIGGAERPDLIADRVMSVDWSADGTQLLVGGGVPSRSGELAIFQVADGVRTFHLPQAHDDVIHAARLSPDGRRIASGGADKYLRTFDIASVKQLRRFEGHTNYVLAVAWKGDGVELASAGADAALKVWDADTADQKQSIVGFTRHVTGLEYRGATDEIVSTCGDKQVRIHNATNGGLVRTMAPVLAWLHGLDVAPAGDVVAAGSADGTVHLWNATTGGVLLTIPSGRADLKKPAATAE